MKHKHLQNLLYKQFDSTLSQEEKIVLEKGLDESEELRMEKEQFSDLRNTLKNNRQKSFKPFFSERIMNKLNDSNNVVSELDDFVNSLLFSFKRIAFASLVVTALLLSNNLIQADEITFESAIGFEKVSVVDVFDPTFMLNED